jgi:hypothetical protein
VRSCLRENFPSASWDRLLGIVAGGRTALVGFGAGLIVVDLWTEETITGRCCWATSSRLH